MTSVNLYRCFCIEENNFLTIWDTTPPTVCTNPIPHVSRALDESKTVIVATLGQDITYVSEKVDGSYQARSFDIDVPSGTTGSISSTLISWPYLVNLRQASFTASDDMYGDVLNVIVAPNSPIGYITSTLTGGSGTNVTINCSSTVFLKLQVGYNIDISTTGSQESLGEVVSMDENSNSFVIQYQPTNDYPIGSIILLNYYIVKNWKIRLTNYSSKFSSKGITTKLIPANIPIQVLYTNNSGTAKSWSLQSEVTMGM